MPASAGIGTENLEWYFRNVRLLPYGVDDIVLLGEREFHRFRAQRTRSPSTGTGTCPELRADAHTRAARAADAGSRRADPQSHCEPGPPHLPAPTCRTSSKRTPSGARAGLPIATSGSSCSSGTRSTTTSTHPFRASLRRSDREVDRQPHPSRLRRQLTLGGLGDLYRGDVRSGRPHP